MQPSNGGEQAKHSKLTLTQPGNKVLQINISEKERIRNRNRAVKVERQ